MAPLMPRQNIFPCCQAQHRAIGAGTSRIILFRFPSFTDNASRFVCRSLEHSSRIGTAALQRCTAPQRARAAAAHAGNRRRMVHAIR